MPDKDVIPDTGIGEAQEPTGLKPWQSKVGNFIAWFFAKMGMFFMDLTDRAMKPLVTPFVKDMRDSVERDTSLTREQKDSIKAPLNRYMKEGQAAWAAFGISMATGAASTASSTAMSPWMEKLKQSKAKKFPYAIFDYPIILAAYLRGIETIAQGNGTPREIWDDLARAGWDKGHIALLKKVLWLRLDPDTIARIWLRDKEKYEHLWKDLHEIGWDDERIEVYKTLAHLIPGAADLIRMAVREVFTPEIVEKYGQMEDFPEDFKKWAEKVGLSEEWAKNYWAAHWDLPSVSQGFEMLHRGIISYDDLKTLLRTLDVMPYWRDKMIKMAYSPYTRVDVRRMYKEGVIDEAGVKRTYLDLGYDDEHAQNLTDFTIKTYARPEDAVEDEEEKIRELTRADICDGYKRGLFTAAEATELLAKLAYTPESIQFYLDREDLKKDQSLRDAYATNYRQLFVIGLKDADTVISEMVALGFSAGEVNEYLRLWGVEKLRRVAKPSRTDLARFLKKEIITVETWRQSMADLGYGDKYIDWYLADME
jgi:hypothetical protein